MGALYYILVTLLSDDKGCSIQCRRCICRERDVYGTLLLQLPKIGDGQEENSWADKISSRIGLYFFGRSGAAFWGHKFSLHQGTEVFQGGCGGPLKVYWSRGGGQRKWCRWGGAGALVVDTWILYFSFQLCIFRCGGVGWQIVGGSTNTTIYFWLCNFVWTFSKFSLAFFFPHWSQE